MQATDPPPMRPNRTVAKAALAAGGLAMGAFALGAIAVGAFAIGRLSVRKARFGTLEIDRLIIHELDTP